MEITLKPVPYKQKHILWNLLELYCYDFSEYIGSDVNESGRFGYRYLDHYWTEKGRHPFLIMQDNIIVGFVLINQHILLPENTGGFALAEFFVLKRHRRKGVGKAAAFMAFDQFPGKWEISVYRKNQPAVQFWDKAVREYTKRNYKEKEQEGFLGQKAILYFRNDGT